MKKTEAPGVSVYALIRKNGRTLLTQDHYKPGWKLPGGGVKGGELIIEALRREVREEVNLELRIRQLLGIANWLKKGSSQARIRIYLVADVRAGTMSIGEEVSAARWFDRRELRRLKREDFLLPQHYHLAVRQYLEGRGTPLGSGSRSDPRRYDLILGK